jgi:hypothetical protein
MTIQPGKVRDWHAYAVPASTLHVHREDATTVRISKFKSADFTYAWLLIDGDLYPLGAIRDGTHAYQVPESGTRLATFIGEARGQAYQAPAQLLGAIRTRMPIQQGVWLIAVADSYRMETDQAAMKVRDLSMILVQDTEGMHAN